MHRLDFKEAAINLRSPKVESIATFLDLRSDPNTGANAINVMTNSDADAKKIEERLSKVPEVLRVMSLDSFVPEDQPAKLKLIGQGAKIHAEQTPIKFYQDHCRDRDCGHCRKLHLRVSPTGEGWGAVPCFLPAQSRIIPLAVDGRMSAERFEDAIRSNGRGPSWFAGTAYESRG
jgi:hypothetical protein